MKNRILYNGIEIPPIGFGTDMTFLFLRKNVLKGTIGLFSDLICNQGYYLKRDCSIYNIVKSAPDLGCHLFDTASAYGQSERILGMALKNYQDSFIVTKLSNREQREGNVEKALRLSLKKLKKDSVDLYLMHWPQTETFVSSWKQMERIYKMGLVKSIGVCNFKIHHFEILMNEAEIVPMVNQVECHPLFTQEDIKEYCDKNKIQLMAYTPTGRMDKRLANNIYLLNLANKYNKSVPQIILRWHYQRGIIPVVNTTKIEHLKQNMNIFDFELTKYEMDKIMGLNMNCRLRYDPDTVDFNKC